jgi:ribosomal protein L11
VLSQVSQVLRRYFAAAFQLPPEEMTTAEFCSAITADTRIGPELSVPLVEFLRACDERKFSPAPKFPPSGSVVEQALKFVWLGQTRLEEEHSKVPSPVSASSVPRLNDE